MPLGNGIIFLVGSEQVAKDDVVSFVFATPSASFPTSCADCQAQEVSCGYEAFLNSHHKKLEPMGKPKPCLGKSLLPPPGERELLIFAPFFGGCV